MSRGETVSVHPPCWGSLGSRGCGGTSGVCFPGASGLRKRRQCPEERGSSRQHICPTAQMVGHRLSGVLPPGGLRLLQGPSLLLGTRSSGSRPPGRLHAHCWPNSTREAPLVPKGPTPVMTVPMTVERGSEGKPGVRVGALRTWESVGRRRDPLQVLGPRGKMRISNDFRA